MSRRLVVPGAVAALALGAVVYLPTADAAPRGAACQISGTATISPGLAATAKPQKVTLKGVTLTGCRGGSSASPGMPTAYTGKVTTSPNPVSTTGSCASPGNLVLKATIAWSTGKTTVANVTTRGAAATQAIQGRVASSTDPNIKANDLVAGAVAFRPVPASQNCARTPVKSVTFSGAIGIGSPR